MSGALNVSKAWSFHCISVLASVLLVMAVYSMGEEVNLIYPGFAFLPIKTTPTVSISLLA